MTVVWLGFYYQDMPRLILYGLLRFLLFSAAVALALFPTIRMAHDVHSWSPLGLAHAINDSGHFRDLFFVIAPAAAVALATTLDFLCAAHTSDETRLSVVIALVINVMVLMSGFIGFMAIPATDLPLPKDQVLPYSWAIWIAIGITLGTELWVSGAAERMRSKRNARTR